MPVAVGLDGFTKGSFSYHFHPVNFQLLLDFLIATLGGNLLTPPNLGQILSLGSSKETGLHIRPWVSCIKIANLPTDGQDDG